MLYPIKIEFKDYPSGSWQDWTQYLAEFPSTNQRVESENDGEAGVIVFDSASVTFRYEPGNPVYTAFSVDLSSKQRYLFRISLLKSNKTYVQRMEGMADFSTIEWPENEQDVISFDIVDKISALGVLSAELSRTKFSFEDRVLAQQPETNHIYYDLPVIHSSGQMSVSARTPGGDILPLITPVINPGEIVIDPRSFINNTDLVYYVVKTSFIQSGVNFLTVYPDIQPREEDYLLIDISAGGNNILSKELYGIDINNIVNGALTSLKGIETIKALYNQAWPGESFTIIPADLDFAIPPEYAVMMTDENPLGDTPLGALSTILNSVKPSDSAMSGCYFYINKSGSPVIHSKNNLDSGTSRSLGTTKVIRRRKKYFWDKLIDGTQITVKSWVTDEAGEYLQGICLKTLQAPGSTGFIKPKNQKDKSILAPIRTPAIDTQELLDSYAAEEADNFLQFYGKRRSAYEFELKLDDNTIQWELVDCIVIDSIKYFFISLEVDPIERTISLEAIETTGHDFDFRQIVVGLSDSNSVSGSFSSSNQQSSGSNQQSYTFTLPLYLTGTKVAIKNFAFDTGDILALRDGSIPQELRVYNSFTDASNNEFLSLGFKNNSNVFTIETEKTGSGVIRDLAIMGGKVGIGTISPNYKVDVSENFPGTMSALALTNQNNGYPASVIMDLRLTGSDDVANIGCRILVGKEQSWSATASTRDSYLAISTRLDNVLTERLRITSEGKIGIGVISPNEKLEVNGNIHLSGDDRTIFNRSEKALSFGTNNLERIKIDPSGNITVLNGFIGTDSYQSQLTGWRVTNAGAGDFRYLYTDELHAKAFIADLEQALAGSQIICKSVTKVAADITLPSIGESCITWDENTTEAGTSGTFISVYTYTRFTTQINLSQMLKISAFKWKFHHAGTYSLYFSTSNNGVTVEEMIAENVVIAASGDHTFTLQSPKIYSAGLYYITLREEGSSGYSYRTSTATQPADLFTVQGNWYDGNSFINYTLPLRILGYKIAAIDSSSRLVVESFAGFETAAVFQNGDLVRLRQYTRTSGSLSISDAWGTVSLDTTYGSSGFDTDSKTQGYVFQRHSTVPGSATGTIKEGTLALDYGVSGNGYIEANAIDGLWAQHSPYQQIVTWNNTPDPGNFTIHNRTGKLTGITDNDFGGTLPAEFGTYLNGTAFIKGNIVVKASNQLALQNTSIMIGNVSGSAFNAVKIAQTGTAGTSGIFLYDNSGNELLKFALDGQRHIANWNFTKDYFYKGTSAAGFSLNTSSSPFITGNNSKGFEIYDVNNPKMFIGLRDSSGNLLKGMDWNITTPNEFTFKAGIIDLNGLMINATGGINFTDPGFFGTKAINWNYDGNDVMSMGLGIDLNEITFLGINTYGRAFELSDALKVDEITSFENLTLNPEGKSVLPGADYSIYLGASNQKFKQLHCSELVVQKLISENVMATIGGRILIGQTNTLLENISNSSTLVTFQYQFSGTLPIICYLEGVDITPGSMTAKVEFIRIDSYSGAYGGGYRYNITRNLDGTGANSWRSGDAVFNTGNTGSGFIDLYSLNSIAGASQLGPSIVGNIRNSTTYNDWSQAWAIGNLGGLYGQTSGTFGVGLGKYSNNNSFMVISPAGGIQFKKRLSGTDYLTAQWAADGTITIGSVSAAHTIIDANSIKLKSGTNDRIVLNNDGSGSLANGDIFWNEAGAITINAGLAAEKILAGTISSCILDACSIKAGGSLVFYDINSEINGIIQPGPFTSGTPPFRIEAQGALELTGSDVTFNGTSIYNTYTAVDLGPNNPSSGLGKDGDIIKNTYNNYVHIKIAGQWTGNLLASNFSGTNVQLTSGGFSKNLSTSVTNAQLLAQAVDQLVILPPGGTAGQVLKKASNSDYDVEWGIVGNLQFNWAYSAEYGTTGSTTTSGTFTRITQTFNVYAYFRLTAVKWNLHHAGTYNLYLGNDDGTVVYKYLKQNVVVGSSGVFTFTLDNVEYILSGTYNLTLAQVGGSGNAYRANTVIQPSDLFTNTKTTFDTTSFTVYSLPITLVANKLYSITEAS